ncbi:hypothetical protein D3C79_494750 [compost metagenome]
MPAQQGFQAGDSLRRVQFELRLVVQLQLLPADGQTQTLKTLLFTLLGDAHHRIEAGDAITTGFLCLVHREVSIDDQLVRCGRITFGAVGAGADAKAGAHVQAYTVNRQRRLQALEQPCGQVDARLLGSNLPSHHDKLVATNSGQQILAAQLLAKALGNRYQHLVTHVMTVVIVDDLQPVQVDEHQRQLLCLRSGQGNVLLQASMQGPAIHAVGQGVMTGQVIKALAQLQLFADVIAHANQQLPPPQQQFTDADVQVEQRSVLALTLQLANHAIELAPDASTVGRQALVMTGRVGFGH